MRMQTWKHFSEVLCSCRMSRNMSNHLERTADVRRAEVTSDASVIQIQDISPTVKALKLQVKNENFSFMAGQWVDFFIPNLDVVGGFSMYTSPRMLEKSKVLGLAVKYSTHPPAHWIHKKCKVGDIVSLKVGGECVWDPRSPGSRKNTLLIAGGIGINPIFSILQHIEDSKSSFNENGHDVGKSVLLYSSSTTDGLIFKKELDLLSNKSPTISCHFSTTKEANGKRINAVDVSNALKTLSTGKQGVQCFLCGPPPMIQNMIQILKENGVNSTDINYEQWW
ncbi:oxidoreductase NAD-binding domain-containing protein 1-like isoform X2 [Rhopilema esculentum]|uniref:oxidoreductase NAD-binding domain-containing protein 1-like isoform X2 n=1 Tax=Rhopilema esculentum TaxID=499914 RepID=UPI0031D703A0